MVFSYTVTRADVYTTSALILQSHCSDVPFTCLSWEELRCCVPLPICLSVFIREVSLQGSVSQPPVSHSSLYAQKIWISPCIWPHVNQMSRISRISKKHNRCSLYKDSTNAKSNKNLWFLLSSVNLFFSIAKKENKQVIKHIIYHQNLPQWVSIN